MSILLDTNGSTITNSQKQLLESYLLLPVPDRLSFYLKLYEFTGNTAALDMAARVGRNSLRIAPYELRRITFH